MRIFANTIEEFFNNSNQHKELLIKIDETIKNIVPNLERKLYESSSITVLGYGYMYYKLSKTGTIPIISIAPQKHTVNVYIMAFIDGKSIVETYASKLGKVSCGLSCIRIKKFEHLNLIEFENMIKETEIWNNETNLNT